MKKKLLLLDLVLLLLTAAAGWHLRREWNAAKAREEAVLKQRVRAIPAPPLSPLKPSPPVTALGYATIAEKTLFSRDRNPNVVVEVAPPPPPKPMPPPPVLRGVMNLGDGPVAIAMEKAGAQHKEYRVGENIGEFKLVGIRAQEIVLEWDGKTITRSLEQLVQAEPASLAGERTAAPPLPAAVVKSNQGPANDIGGGMRACAPNDSTPAGAVVDGYRKVVVPSPFGPSCRWETAR